MGDPWKSGGDDEALMPQGSCWLLALLPPPHAPLSFAAAAYVCCIATSHTHPCLHLHLRQLYTHAHTLQPGFHSPACAHAHTPLLLRWLLRKKLIELLPSAPWPCPHLH